MKKAKRFLLLLILGLLLVNVTGYNRVHAATVSEAMNWCEGLLGQKVGSGQCVALIQNYYEYLGKSRVYGNACDYSTNAVPVGWSRVKGGTPQAGDILVYVGAKYGHVAIYAGGTMSYHQNMSGKYVEKKTNWAYNKSWYSNAEGGTKSYWGYIRPDFGEDVCNCSESYAGNYTCTSNTTLNIRNGHSTSASVVGSIPNGATVYVSKSDGTWAHIEYNGINGYASMSYLSKIQEPEPPAEIRGSEMSSGFDRVLPDGNYIIASAANPQYFLDIVGAERPAANETNVALCVRSDELAEYDTWTIKYADGFYRIYQNGTDISLDVHSGDTLQETNVQVYANNDSSAQKWAISTNGRNGYRIQAKCSGYSLDISGGNIANGVNVRQYSGNDTSAQEWIFIPYKPVQDISEGRYILLSDLDQSMELDVAGDTGDISDETNVQIWKDTASSQYNSFDITKLDNGYYKIIHAASGKALDMYGGGTNLLSNISLHEENGSDPQQWAILNAGENSFILWARCSGMVMDVENSNTANGTNVSQYSYHGGKNQRWHFVRAENTVVYDSMGGTDTPEKQIKYYKNDLKLRSAVPQRENYIFKGWSDSKDSNEIVYAPGSTYTKDEPLSLYAIWEKQSKSDIPVLSVSQDGEKFVAALSNLDHVTGFGFVYGKEAGVTLETSGRICVAFTDISENHTFTFDASGLDNHYFVRGYVLYSINGEETVLYADPVAVSSTYLVCFDANGGTCTETERTVAKGSRIGALPIPVKDYFRFTGWCTEDGQKVSGEQSFSGEDSIKLTASWEEKEASEFVREDQVPAGAQIVEEKYTYTKRNYTSESNGTMVGWTLYDTKRTRWGDTQGPVYSDPSNGERNVWSENYVTSSNYKTVYHYFRYSTGYTASGGSDKATSKYGTTLYTYTFDDPLTVLGTKGNYSTGYKYYYSGSKYCTVWKSDPFTTQERVSDNYGTRWYYQEPVYTYYFYRDEEKTSGMYPNEADISNVLKWVKYREK